MMSEITANRLPPLALLAGGLATRLRPLTDRVAKSMVMVAGEPFIAHQLRLLVRKGISDVVVCAGHFGGQISAFVKDGRNFGLNVRYSYDGQNPLGTGGALRRALPLLGEWFFAMYGDSYLDTNFARVFEAFRRSGLPGLMTVFRNQGGFDRSNVEFTGGVIRRYDKHSPTPAMLHLDYGLGVFAASLLRSWPQDAAFDLADLYHDLAERRLLAGCEVAERFYEIGSPAGLAECDAFVRRMRAAGPDVG